MDGPNRRPKRAADDRSEGSVGTRAKILDVCRVLFNERSPAEVTTAEIAAAVAISEGNLHYHFRRKEQILSALFDEFEAALDRVAEGRRGSRQSADEPYAPYLTAWFNLMWEWRCFYGASVYRVAPSLQPRLLSITDRGQANVRQYLTHMAATNRLRATPEEIDRLVVNAWIVGTYWIDYLRTRQGVGRITRDHIRWGFAQVQALFTPHAVRLPAPEPAAQI